jgi:uncharacterized membrane protein
LNRNFTFRRRNRLNGPYNIIIFTLKEKFLIIIIIIIITLKDIHLLYLGIRKNLNIKNKNNKKETNKKQSLQNIFNKTNKSVL